MLRVTTNTFYNTLRTAWYLICYVLPLTRIITRYVLYDIFPDSLELALVTPMPKGDSTSAGNYRLDLQL